MHRRMKCITMRSIVTLLFVSLTTKTMTERIHNDDYISMIANIRKYYHASCVVFVHRSYQDLNIMTRVHTWVREFSQRQIMTTSLTFWDLMRQYNEYQKVVLPLFVVLLDTIESMSEFALVTKNLEPISFPVWFVLFLQHPGDPLKQYCRLPTENIFNVNFGTIMLVLCYDHPILTEWYALRDNRIRTYELATWSSDRGLIPKTRQGFYDRRNNLFGETIHVVTVSKSPFFWLENDTFSGFFGSLLVELSRTMNFTILLREREEAYGSWNKHAKRWTGVIGNLVSGEADLGIGGFTISESRLNVIDFTLPLVQSHIRLYIRQPNGSDVQWLGYFKAFSTNIWKTIGAIIVCTPVLLAVIETKGCISISDYRLILEKYTQIWGIYCQQGLSEFPNESRMRLAFFSIFISSLIVSAAYSASLISFLTLPMASLPFSTLEGFVKDGSYKLIVLKNSVYYDSFNHAMNPLSLQLNATMKKDLPLTELGGFMQVCKENAALYTTEVVEEFVRLPCKVTYIGTGRIDSMAWVLRKGSPYKDIINYHLQRFLDNGVIKKLRKKYILTIDPSESKHGGVSLWSIAPILTVMASGVILGIFILIFEKAYYCFNLRRRGAQVLFKKSNRNPVAKLHAKLQERNSTKNQKFRKFYDMYYGRPIGYWP